MQMKDLGEEGGIRAWRSFPDVTKVSLRSPLQRIRKKMYGAASRQIEKGTSKRQIVLNLAEFDDLDSLLTLLEFYPSLRRKFRQALDYQWQDQKNRKRAIKVLEDKSIQDDKERFRQALEKMGLARTTIRSERKGKIKADYDELTAHIKWVRQEKKAGRVCAILDPDRVFKNPILKGPWTLFRPTIYAQGTPFQQAQHFVVDLLTKAYDFPTANACRQALKRQGARLPQAGDLQTD